MKKRMKKIWLLTAGVFLLCGVNAFAEPVTTQTSTNRIEYVYNPFGVAIASTDITTTVTTTKDETAGQTSTTTNTSIAKSIWKGGGLKVESVNGTSNAVSSDNKNNQKSEEDKRWSNVIEMDGKYYWPDSSRGKPQAGTAYASVLTLLNDEEIKTYKTWKTGSLSDNAVSHTEFSTNYTYNADGQLSGATGTSKTTGNRGKDSNGQKIGTYESTEADNYIVKNGQALRTSSVTKGTNSGADGKKTSDFTDTANYTNELMGGSWQVTKETTVSDVKEVSGTTEKVTKTKTYTRDANGITTGVAQTATGTRKVVNPNGGTFTFEIRDYKPEFKSDAKAGWYLAKEAWTWVNTDPPPPPRSDPAITGNLILMNNELFMFVNTITDHNSAQSGEGRVVKIQAAESQEAEFEALKNDLVGDNGGSLEGYTIWGDYLGDYTSQNFVFQGAGYGPFQPK